jgi:hypothetical protein
MAYLHWVMCHNRNHPSMWIERCRLFKNYYYYYYLKLNIGTHGNASFALNNEQNSYILVACDNMHIMELKDELVFVDFFIHPIPFVVCN